MRRTSTTTLLSRRRALAFLVAAPVCLPYPSAAAPPPTVRVGVLKYGTAEWEIDVIVANRFDSAAGIRVDALPLASGEAARIALLGGAVDVIVSDWIWVSRERSEGRNLTVIPFSRAVGGVVVGREVRIASVVDLRGARLGVAGGPLDKGWLLLRALARRDFGFDPARQSSVSFAAPPLLEQQLRAGRLDAVMTYWQSSARLEVDGYRTAFTVAEVMRQLGATDDVPMLGYVFGAAWAAARPDVVTSFARASRSAKMLLAQSDDEWRRIAPLTGAADGRMLALLRDGYRAGIPGPWDQAARAGAERLFAYLAETGGAELVGDARSIAPGTFWSGVL